MDLVIVDVDGLEKEDYDKSLVAGSVLTLDAMMKLCPNPTQTELRKMLAMNGFIMQKKAIEYMEKAKGEKKGDKSMVMALRASAAATNALVAAANIKLESDSE